MHVIDPRKYSIGGTGGSLDAQGGDRSGSRQMRLLAVSHRIRLINCLRFVGDPCVVRESRIDVSRVRISLVRDLGVNIRAVRNPSIIATPALKLHQVTGQLCRCFPVQFLSAAYLRKEGGNRIILVLSIKIKMLLLHWRWEVCFGVL